MKVFEAFDGILDASFSVVIDGIHFLTADRITDDLKNKEIRNVYPHNDKLEAYFVIRTK